MVEAWILVILIFGSPIILGEYDNKQNCQQALEVTKKLRDTSFGWPFNEKFVSRVVGCIPTMKELKPGIEYDKGRTRSTAREHGSTDSRHGISTS